MLLTVDEPTGTGDTIFGRWLHLQVVMCRARLGLKARAWAGL